MRLCTYNASGLRDFNKRKQIFVLLKYKKVDIVFIQETHMLEEDLSMWQNQWGGKMISAYGAADSRGMLILLRKHLNAKIKDINTDVNGRFIVVELEIDGIEIVLSNVYAPNRDSPTFFAEVVAIVELYENPNVIWGGDFNFAVNPFMDRKLSHHNNDLARDFFIQYCNDNDLVDVWRLMNPELRQYSCCHPNSTDHNWHKFSRLDMFFMVQGLANNVSKSIMQTGFQSDHSFVIMDLSFSEHIRGPGYWKFNVEHLHDPKFVKAMNAIIEESQQGNQLDNRSQWQKTKGAMIQFCKQYSIDKAKERNQIITELEKSAADIKSKIEGSKEIDPLDLQLQNDIQGQLQAFIEEKTKGALIRSRNCYYELGERSYKYFFALEKCNAKRKTMRKVKNSAGQIIHDPKVILEEQVRFYQKLYQSNGKTSFSNKKRN